MIYSKILIGLALSSGALAASQAEEKTSMDIPEEYRPELRRLRHLRIHRLQAFRNSGRKYHKINRTHLPGEYWEKVLYGLRGEAYLNDHHDYCGYQKDPRNKQLVTDTAVFMSILCVMGIPEKYKEELSMDQLLTKDKVDPATFDIDAAQPGADELDLIAKYASSWQKVEKFKDPKFTGTQTAAGLGTGYERPIFLDSVAAADWKEDSADESSVKDSVRNWEKNHISYYEKLTVKKTLRKYPIEKHHSASRSPDPRRRLAHQGFAKRLERFAREEAYASS